MVTANARQARWVGVLVGAWGLMLVAGGLRVWAAEPTASKRAVVMISVDGLAAFYWDDPQAKMPTIRALAESGAWARMKAAAPTVTWPNHTNLVTGVTTSRHGVVGNDYYDRTRRQPVALILDPEFDKDEIIRVPTIYDAAHTAGLKTAAVRWPASRNAKSLDWTVPEVGSNEQLHKYTTQSLLSECQAKGIWADGEPQRNGQREIHILSDEACVRVFNHILREHRPNLSLLHVIHVDHVEHVSGPRSPEAYAAIEAADSQVREVWEEMKRDFPGTGTLLVVSDHGFSPIEHLILPNVRLRDAGLVKVQDDKATAGDVHVIIQGGAAMVYVVDANRRAELVPAIRQLFEGTPGIEKIVGPGQLKEHGVAEPDIDPHAPDMILFAKEGYGFKDKATGSVAVTDETERRGTHGHNENLPNLHASFIAWGAGIKPGSRPGMINNTDVAPTIARLLEVKLEGTDGKPVTAALAE